MTAAAGSPTRPAARLVSRGRFDYKRMMAGEEKRANGALDAAGMQERPGGQWWEFCPVCSSRLINHKCRFVCSNPQCHYFMSCSEFDL
jgi:hypothetical protein